MIVEFYLYGNVHFNIEVFENVFSKNAQNRGKSFLERGY